MVLALLSASELEPLFEDELELLPEDDPELLPDEEFDAMATWIESQLPKEK